MTYDEWADGIDGIMAYDNGCTDSGIKDEALRARLMAILDSTVADEWVTRFVRDRCVSEDAMAQGYNWEDAKGFFQWLEERMDFS